MRVLAISLVLGLAACTPESIAGPRAAEAAPPVVTPVEPGERPIETSSARLSFARCRSGALTVTAAEFSHRRNALLARSVAPLHHAHDVAANPNARVVVEGKFAYGELGKDLEDEPVGVWLDDCSSVRELGRGTTDGDGRARIEITAPERAGEYAMHFVVDGDASSTRASLFVLERGTPIVVFDIDGTLTQSDAEVSRDVLDDHFDAMYEGDYVPKIYADGAVLAEIWADKGVLPIYVSGRPYWLSQYSRDWLEAEHFPRGLVRTTDRHREVVPKVEGVGQFKAAMLARLLALGVVVEAAYGNATTDIWAYAEAGIPLDRTFIIGPHAGGGGTRAVHEAWTSALPWARAQAVPSGALQLR